jgi:2-amino-4-hydroxy-6-hydroxymethyldihydropteridine diphosphokinase
MIDAERPDSVAEAVAYIALGANQDAEANLRRALAMLRTACEVLALSSVYQSPAYGWENQPDFLDITAKIRTSLSPEAFKTTVLDVIERACGRDRASQQSKYGPLPMDMDILLWDAGGTGGASGAFTYGSKPWTVPNSGILKYAAVAIPLAELAPDLRHPITGATLRAIADAFGEAERAAVRRVDTGW